MSIENPWGVISSTEIYDNPWIQVRHDEVTTPTGGSGIYGVVSFKNLAIGVVPIDEHDHTWLVGQYRYAPDEYSWEIPAGGGDPNQPVEATAKRELIEECGIEARDFRLLHTTRLSNSVTDELAYLLVATDLTFCDADPDPTEKLDVRRLPVDEAIRMAYEGEINDAISILALLRLGLERGYSPTP